MGVLDGVVIIEGEGTVLEVNLGTLLHSCAEVSKLIELSFGVVSVVGPGVVGVLGGG